MTYIKYFSILFVALLFGLTIKYLIVNNFFTASNNTKLVFEKKVYDLGNLEFEEMKEVYFKYTNIGNNPLVLNEIQSRCGCTVTKWNKEKLLPGKSDSLLVQFNSETEGFFTKEVLVFSNCSSSPDHIFIQGTVIRISINNTEHSLSK